MANFRANDVVILDKMLEFLSLSDEVIKHVNKEFNTAIEAQIGKAGQTVSVEKPARYVGQSGWVINAAEDINIGTISVSVDQHWAVPVNLTAQENTFSSLKDFDVWAEKNLKPMVEPIVAQVQGSLFGLSDQVANFVGTAGTGFGTNVGMDTVLAAKEKLDYMNTPKGGRVQFINPTAARKLGGQLTTQFNPTSVISKTFTEGTAPPIGGFMTYEAPNVNLHTNGSIAGTVLVNGANQVGSTVSIDGITNTAGLTFKKGDVINFTGVHSINPSTKKSTGLLQDFVITADTVQSGGAITALPISPAIITSGAFQTVDGSPADNAPLYYYNTNGTFGAASTAYAQNLAFWEKALGLITVPINVPKAPGIESTTRNYNGLSLTMTRGGSIRDRSAMSVVEMAWGVVCYYPENCVRITN